MKRKHKKDKPKERNEFVVSLIHRQGAGAGSHGKSKKALRRKEKVSLQNQEYCHKVV
jgi:hypothetical protein